MEINQNNVKNTVSVSTVVTNGLIALLSVAIIVIASEIVNNSASALYMAMMSVGVIGVLISLINIIFRSKVEVYTLTGSKIRKIAINCNSATTTVNKLCQILDGCNAEELQSLQRVDNGDILVEIKYSKDNKFGAYQISNYVPYQYEVAAAWKEIESENIKQLRELSSK